MSDVPYINTVEDRVRPIFTISRETRPWRASP